MHFNKFIFIFQFQSLPKSTRRLFPLEPWQTYVSTLKLSNLLRIPKHKFIRIRKTSLKSPKNSNYPVRSSILDTHFNSNVLYKISTWNQARSRFRDRGYRSHAAHPVAKQLSHFAYPLGAWHPGTTYTKRGGRLTQIASHGQSFDFNCIPDFATPPVWSFKNRVCRLYLGYSESARTMAEMRARLICSLKSPFCSKQLVSDWLPSIHVAAFNMYRKKKVIGSLQNLFGGGWNWCFFFFWWCFPVSSFRSRFFAFFFSGWALGARFERSIGIGQGCRYGVCFKD